jgi:hypothetical protein
MPHNVIYYTPPGGTKITVKVMNGNNNAGEALAERLFHTANRECPQPGLEGETFKPNYVYEFANGLVFRLFDDGLDPQGKVLEFYVPEAFQHSKQQVLSRIPRLLQMAGVEEEALASLKGIFQSRNSPHTRGGV